MAKSAGGGGRVGRSAPRIVDFEQFAAERSAGRFAWDVSTQRMPGASAGQRLRTIREQVANQRSQSERRTQARADYDRLVASGAIRPPTRVERLVRTAQGHSDNQAVQAARRLLTKQGIRWDS